MEGSTFHHYFRAYLDLKIALDGNKFYSILDFGPALSVTTMTDAGLQVVIQASNFECKLPTFALLSAANIFPTVSLAREDDRDKEKMFISREYMKTRPLKLAGVYIPPPGTLGCFYTLKKMANGVDIGPTKRQVGISIIASTHGAPSSV